MDGDGPWRQGAGAETDGSGTGPTLHPGPPREDALALGLDGGGTWTRAAVIDGRGRLLGAAIARACNPEVLPVAECRANAVAAASAALARAGVAASALAGAVAGIAGREAAGDGGAWVQEIGTALGLSSGLHVVGDEIVAQFGAFAGGPGVIAVAGTGCIVYGLGPDGRGLRNYDFGHYAPAGAFRLGHDLLLRLAAGEVAGADLSDQVWGQLGLDGVVALRRALQSGTGLPVQRLAPLLTAAAAAGDALARDVCDLAVAELARGVRLLGPEMGPPPVRVAPAGSVASSSYMVGALGRALARSDGAWRVQAPLARPVLGAATLALALRGVGARPGQLRDLESAWEARASGLDPRGDDAH